MVGRNILRVRIRLEGVAVGVAGLGVVGAWLVGVVTGAVREGKQHETF